MSALVDQLCAACKRFSEETGDDEHGMAAYLLFYSGGALAPNVPRTGKVTIEHAQGWLNTLVHERYFDEEFVARGLARCIEDEFERLLEDYAVGLATRRRVFQFAIDMGASPEDLGSSRSFMTEGSLEDMKRRKDTLEAWREVAASLLDPR